MKLLYILLIPGVIISSIANVESSDYEAPKVLHANEFLPEEVLNSDLYTIRNEIETEGFTNTYYVSSDFGEFIAHGNETLYKVVQEIKAINELAKLKDSDQFIEGAKASAKSPFNFIESLINEPVDTIIGIPEGLWQYGSRAAEMTTQEKSEFEDNFGKELILFSSIKRKLAYDLNVDVYSSNKVLQEHLNSVSWAAYSGGFVVSIALRPLTIVRLTKTGNTLNGLIRDKPPEDLRRINRAKLREMDVNEDVIEHFLNSQWLSPRHETIIVGELSYQGIKDGLEEYLMLASSSESEQDAFFHQNIIQLIGHYLDNTTETDVKIVVRDNFTLLKVRKHYVFPLLVDYGNWTERGEAIINEFEHAIRGQGDEDIQILLWITGVVSDRAKAELKNRKIILVENAFDTGASN